MDFSFTDEQRMLRDTVASFLADRYAFEARQAVMNSPAGWSPQVWKALAQELGVLGAAFPEEAGGLGGGPVETMILMEEFGAGLLIEPFLETVVIAGGLFKHSNFAGAQDWLGRIAAGEAVLALAHTEPASRYDLADVSTSARRAGGGWRLDGRKAVVHAAPWASHLIVSARMSGERRDPSGIGLFLVDKSAAGVTTRDYVTVDGRRASEVLLDGAEVADGAVVAAEDDGLALIERVTDEASCAVCAESLGLMRRMQQDTVEYARQRRQFGRPISEFQVLQHRMVDMYLALEQAVSTTYYATLMLDAPNAERARAASAAKVQVGKSSRLVGQEAVQIHGGIGMTNELALGWYFKRATVVEGLFGDTDHHLERFQRLGSAEAG